MKPAELAKVRGRLVAFAEEMLASLARKDQRRWGECYLRGLAAGRQAQVDRADGRPASKTATSSA